MAKKKKPGARAGEAKPASPTLPPAVVIPRRRDPRRVIYACFDLAFTIAYWVLFTGVLHNRHGWARMILYLLPASCHVMAIGTVAGNRVGWWLTIAGGCAMLLWTLGFVALLLYTAAYLSGVYGSFGKAAASGAVLAVAFVFQFAATLPVLQLKWALTRAGRRAFGLPPLWAA